MMSVQLNAFLNKVHAVLMLVLVVTLSTGVSGAADNVSFHVAEFQFVGVTALDDADLKRLSGDTVGQELTLADLEQFAQRVTDYYSAHGYPFAYAYVPVQEVENGVVTIAVVEGRYSAVTLINTSRLREGMIRALLGPVTKGAVIESYALTRAINRLNNTAGVAARSTFRSGAEEGTMELVVDLTEDRTWSGAFTVDSFGNPNTRRVRGSGIVARHNVSGRGDTLRLQVVSSGKGLLTGRIAYDFVVPSHVDVTRWNASYTQTNYELGGQLGVLDAHGSARVLRISGEEQHVASESMRLIHGVGLETKHLVDKILGMETPRRVHAIDLNVTGEARQSHAVTQFSVGARFGYLTIDEAVAKLQDTLTAQTAGRFVTLNGSVRRVHRLAGSMMLRTSVSGQWASGNLHTSEKFSLGGPGGVRAYAANEASGDEGWLANIELSRSLAWDGVYASIFADGGHVRLNKQPWNAAESNDRALYGVGLGLLYERRNLSLGVEYAVPVGDPSAAAGSRLLTRATWRF